MFYFNYFGWCSLFCMVTEKNHVWHYHDSSVLCSVQLSLNLRRGLYNLRGCVGLIKYSLSPSAAPRCCSVLFDCHRRYFCILLLKPEFDLLVSAYHRLSVCLTHEFSPDTLQFEKTILPRCHFIVVGLFGMVRLSWWFESRGLNFWHPSSLLVKPVFTRTLIIVAVNVLLLAKILLFNAVKPAASSW